MQRKHDATRVRIQGPLAAYQDGLIKELAGKGYSWRGTTHLVYLLENIDRWLTQRNLRPDQFTEENIAGFLSERLRSGAHKFKTERGLNPVLSFLRRAGAIPREEPTQERSALEEIIDGYSMYLANERSVSTITVKFFSKYASRFLERTGAATPSALADLTAASVSAYILREARVSSPGYMRQKIAAVRSFLRYAHAQGLLPGDLSGAVPSVPCRRLTGIPKFLTPAERDLLLRTPNRRKGNGRRAYAVMLIMLRLGLRSCEVAALTLDDINWSRAELTVRGKGGRTDTLPLPKDVGEAIVAYLKRGRPKHNSRAVFLTAYAPIRPLHTGQVRDIVRIVGDKCGLPHLGAHRLRHTAATDMLRNGASLIEVREALRHDGIDTTAIYAKVDDKLLCMVSRPWPGAI